MKPVDAGSAETLWAVVLGAFLATLGGFLATQFEAYLRRHERRRGASLLFGDILSAMAELTRLAAETRGIGDPYGPITMRMLRAARREVDLYERNRETLYDLHDPKLRVKLHTLMVAIAMPLDGLIDVVPEIVAQEARLKTLKSGTAERRTLEARLAKLSADRDNTFDYIVARGQDGEALIDELGRHARDAFARHRPTAN